MGRNQSYRQFVGNLVDYEGKFSEQHRKRNGSKRELRKFRVLYDLAIAMAADRSLHENLQLVVNKIRKLFDADTCYIALKNEDDQYVFMYTLSGIRTATFKNMRLPIGKGLGGLVAKTREGYIIREYLTEKYFDHMVDEIVTNEGLISGMAVPVQMGEKNFGVLYIFNRKRTSFSQSDLDTLFLIGNLAAIEISRKKSVESVRKAHDELGRMVEKRTLELRKMNDLRKELAEVNSNLERRVIARYEDLYKTNVALKQEIKERRIAEQALLDSERQLRALTVQLAEVEEAGRKKLAQELHDRVGQNLTVLNINLSILLGQLSLESREKVSTRLADSMNIVTKTAENIRNVMAKLRPHVLDDYGLMAALRGCSEKFSKRTGIMTELRCEEFTSRLPPGTETAFFRIAQEAMTNVVKHAHATRIILDIEETDDRVRLSISDNGKGFDLTELNPAGQHGWGLITMKERAQAQGGKLLIESGRGKGTRIVVEVKR